MVRGNRAFLKRAVLFADQNDVELSYISVCQYVGYDDGMEAFDLIRRLHLLDGCMEDDLAALRHRWRQQTKVFIENNCPTLMMDVQTLI